MRWDGCAEGDAGIDCDTAIIRMVVARLGGGSKSGSAGRMESDLPNLGGVELSGAIKLNHGEIERVGFQRDERWQI